MFHELRTLYGYLGFVETLLDDETMQVEITLSKNELKNILID
jgi:hypothetical protein